MDSSRGGLCEENPEQHEAALITKLLVRECVDGWQQYAERTLHRRGMLSRRQALVVYLYYYNDLDTCKIAKLLNVAPPTVWKSLQRAHKKLINFAR